MQTTPGTSLTEDAQPHPSPRSGQPLRLWAAVAALVLGLDQATKWWAEHALAEGPRQVLGDWLQFRLAYNPGAAFSLGTGYTVVLTLVALTVIVVCLRLARRIGSRSWALALGLLLGGALGNVTDRIFRDPSPFRGHVVDFIEVPNWPVFNVADSAICVAAALFMLLSFRGVHLDGTVERRLSGSDTTSTDTSPDEPDSKPESS